MTEALVLPERLDFPTAEDSLLAALLFFAKHHGQSVSAESLVAGLPLVNNQLTPELFIRAAARVGLTAKLTQRPLTSVSGLVLPAVIQLKDNRSVVLLAIDHAQQKATLHIPEAEGDIEIDLDELALNYTGKLFLLTQSHRFDERTPELLTVRSRSWFWGTLLRSWRIYRDVLLASLLINLFAVVSPLYVMNVYDRVVPNQAVETLMVLTSGVLIVYLFDFILRTLRGYCIDIAGKKSDVLLSAAIFEQVLGMKLSNRPASVGAFANNLKNFESVRDFITSATITSVVDLPFVLVFLAVIYWVGGWLVVVPLVGVVIIALYSFFIQEPLRESVDKTMRETAQKNATLIESLTALETIKTLNAEGPLQSRWERATGYIADWGIKSRLLSASSTTVATAVQQMVSTGMIVFGVYSIIEGELSMGGLIAVVLLSARVLAPMGQVAGLATRYYYAKAALIGLNEIMAKPRENQQRETFIHQGALSGQIAFEKVAFSYPNEQQQSLKNISITIKAGERVGIIGRVGSGKTTLQRLVLNLYEVDDGAIRVDGVDIRHIDPAQLRNNIGYVGQDPVLFFGSLKDNITYANPYASDDDVLKAAQLSGAAEIAANHSEGFDMPVGERGERLSGGQRQCVALARAILSNPTIVLLDEPSSSLDKRSEDQLINNLKPFLEGKTVILNTHRNPLLAWVDRIIILEQGQVVADSPKDVVLTSLQMQQGT